MAGFFGFFDYSKPGKGVRKDEPQRSRFAQFFILVQRKFWKLIQLNLIYILFCIPIVTIGPATSAMAYVLRQYANEMPVFLFSDFWDAFKANWKQSFVHGLIFTLVGALLVVSVQFYWMNAGNHAWMYLPLGVCFMIGLVMVMANFYINLMIVTLDLKLSAIIKNGFLLSILCLKTNLITLLIVILFSAVMILFFPITIFVMLFLGFSFIWFVIVYNSYRGVKKYAIDPYLKQVEEEHNNQGLLSESEEETVFQDEYSSENKEKEARDEWK